MRFFIATLLGLSAIGGFALEPGDDALLPEGRAWIAATTKAWQQASGDTVQVWPAVKADKASRRVEIAATGAGTEEAGLLEFMLVAEKGKAYESVAVTTAKPSDVVKAMRFVGLPDGRPINYGTRHFWPRGERVKISVVPVDADGKRGKALSGPGLVKHREREDIGTQFVFVGSDAMADVGDAPIVDQTGDLISLYSNPFAVFDVHLRTPQGEHYGATTVAAKGAMDQHQRLIFVLEPEYPAGKKRVCDVALTAAPTADGDELSFSYRQLPDGELAKDLGLPKVLSRLQTLIEEGRDPFVTITFEPETPLALAAEFAKMLDVAAGQTLLRVEPVTAEPYYQALLPDPVWRDRSKRPGQPLELHAKRGPDGWSGKLIRPQFVRVDTGWDVKLEEQAFASMADLLKKIAAEENVQALFYYLPAGATYGDLKSLYSHFGEKWPTQYVFLDGEE